METLKEYLKEKQDNGLMPNWPDFKVWLFEKNIIIPDTKLGEYKGLINDYSLSFLNNKISTGGRNSMALVPLLKQFETKDDQDVAITPTFILDVKEPENKGER